MDRDLEAVVQADLSAAAAGAARLAIQVAGKIVRGSVAVDQAVLTRALETILFKQQAAATAAGDLSARRRASGWPTRPTCAHA